MIAGLVTATVFTCGAAAAAFGVAAAAATPVISEFVVAGVLAGVGGSLATGVLISGVMACKCRMGTVTGNDLHNIQEFTIYSLGLTALCIPYGIYKGFESGLFWGIIAKIAKG